jgi:hypothetical protein
MNKMKLNIATLGVVGLLMTGCTDSFLDTSSKTDLNSTSFYKNQTQAEYALVGCYDGYQCTVSNGSWPTVFQAVETMSDDCLGGGGPDDKSDRLMDRFDATINGDAVDLFNGIWKDYYKGINRCNQLLSSVDNITFGSDSIKNLIAGQARAIRGLEYFDLVRMFERVPLLTTSTTDVVAQSEPDEIYKQIVSDLKFAADTIPAGAYTDNTTSLGRITRYAAAAMLARVYLFYDGVYNNNAGKDMPGGLTKAQALQYCEKVIASNQYSLESNFKNLWPAACTTASTSAQGWINTYKEASSEIMWVVKFNNDQNWNNTNHNGNRFVVNLGMRNVTAYAPYGNGWGACPVTPYAASLYSDKDTRGAATFISCQKIGAYAEQIKTDCMDYTGYVNMKYCPLIYTDGTSIAAANSTVTGANMQTSQDQDWILMRYSDVLLMAAELGSPNAMAYVNQVRDRAYGAGVNDLKSAPTTQQIWDERRLEFMGEGIRYWDLRRQGLDAFVNAQLYQASSNGTATGSAVSVYNNMKTGTISDQYTDNNIRVKRGFFQIPNTQISLSGGVYTQNAGWK